MRIESQGASYATGQHPGQHKVQGSNVWQFISSHRANEYLFEMLSNPLSRQMFFQEKVIRFVKGDY